MGGSFALANFDLPTHMYHKMDNLAAQTSYKIPVKV